MERPIGDNAQDYGQTLQYTGVVGLTPVQIPAVAGDFIATALIENLETSPISRKLFWSLDNVTYHELKPGSYVGWSIKGNYQQIWLKGAVASIAYQVILNTEPS